MIFHLRAISTILNKRNQNNKQKQQIILFIQRIFFLASVIVWQTLNFLLRGAIIDRFLIIAAFFFKQFTFISKCLDFSLFLLNFFFFSNGQQTNRYKSIIYLTISSCFLSSGMIKKKIVLFRVISHHMNSDRMNEWTEKITSATKHY